MDSLIAAAARALAGGDPLGALKRIALRDDPPALALRGIAMAQLGDFARARVLLRRAARAFGPRESVARARCVVAEAEVALAARDLAWPDGTLDAARATLENSGDRVNAAHARLLAARRLALIGRLDAAEGLLARLASEALPAATRAACELVLAGIAIRRIQGAEARAALVRARQAAARAGIPALTAEVEKASLELTTPAARHLAHGTARPLRLEEVEALLASRILVIDACRNALRLRGKVVSLARRPILFEIARTLGEAWPEGVTRDALIARVFRTKRFNESHRSRLRVEVGRLRTVLRPIAGIEATGSGYALVPRLAREVAVLAPPAEDENTAILALLADGESWSTSALALALSASQRSVQRSLQSLAAAGKAQSYGRGRARRWLATPMPGFATTLLLPAPLPVD